MNLTAEWIARAEEDWRVAQRELRVRSLPGFNAICFHAQQCVEKYLKACLHHAGIYFDKTHNLVRLLDQVLVLDPSWSAFRAALHELTTHAVEVRYPGVSADRAMAKSAVATCKAIRSHARKRLKPAARSSGPRRRRPTRSRKRHKFE